MNNSGSKVVPINASRMSGGAPRYGRQPAALIKLQEKQLPALQALLAGVFDAVDDALYELADKATSNAEQNIYFESMRELRIQRRAMESAFEEQLRDQFRRLVSGEVVDGLASVEASELSLVEKDELEELVALDSMVSKAMGLYALPVTQLTVRVSALVGRDLVVRDNPLGPHALCRAFSDVSRPVGLDIKTRLILFKLFDRHVIGQLGSFYQDCNQVLIGEGVLPQGVGRSGPRRPTPQASAPGTPGSFGEGAPTTQQDSVFQTLQSLLAQAQPRPASQDAHGDILPHDTLMDVLSQLQRNAPVPLGGVRLDFHGALQSAMSERWPLASYRVGQVDDDAINLVAMLFQFILEDRNLAAPMKALLSRLQIPILKVSMLDKSFFSRGGHPARKLLNELANAGLGWVAEEDYERDPLYRRVSQVVERLLNDFEHDVSLFAELLTDFMSFREAEQRRASLVQQRLLDAEDGRARSELARQTVNRALDERLAGRQWPPVVETLLRDVWANVMFLACLREGEDSDAWRESLATVDQLLWSVQPQSGEEDRRKLLALLPGLLRGLRQGLTSINYNPYEMSQLLSELEAIHVTFLRRRPEPPVLTPAPATEELQPLQESVDEALDRLAESMFLPGDKTPAEEPVAPAQDAPASVVPEAGSPAPVEDETPVLAPEWLAQLDRLTLGAWVEIQQDDERRFRCRLAAVIKAIGKYIFVNRSGMKVAEYGRDELARALGEGRVVVLDDSQLFDRALASVIGSLRDMKARPM